MIGAHCDVEAGCPWGVLEPGGALLSTPTSSARAEQAGQITSRFYPRMFREPLPVPFWIQRLICVVRVRHSIEVSARLNTRMRGAMSSRSGSPLISRPRPGAAVAAAIVGIVIGAQILIGSFTQFEYAVDNGMTWLLALIAMNGVLWLVGGIQMLGGRRTGLLIGSGVWLALMLAFVLWGWMNALSTPGSSISMGWVAVTALVFAAVPGIVLALAFRPSVTQWIVER